MGFYDLTKQKREELVHKIKDYIHKDLSSSKTENIIRYFQTKILILEKLLIYQLEDYTLKINRISLLL